MVFPTTFSFSIPAALAQANATFPTKPGCYSSQSTADGKAVFLTAGRLPAYGSVLRPFGVGAEAKMKTKTSRSGSVSGDNEAHDGEGSDKVKTEAARGCYVSGDNEAHHGEDSERVNTEAARGGSGDSFDDNKDVSTALILKLAEETALLVRAVPAVREGDGHMLPLQIHLIGKMASEGAGVSELAALLVFNQRILRRCLAQEEMLEEFNHWWQLPMEQLLLQSTAKTRLAVQDYYLKAQEGTAKESDEGEGANKVSADLIQKLAKETATLARAVPFLMELDGQIVSQIYLLGSMACEGVGLSELAALLFLHQCIIRKYLGKEEKLEEFHHCWQLPIESLLLQSTENTRLAVQDYLKGNVEKQEA